MTHKEENKKERRKGEKTNICIGCRKWDSRGDCWTSAMHLECSHGCHQNYSIWHQARVTTLDIEELLHANVSTKASLSDNNSITSNKLWFQNRPYDCQVRQQVLQYIKTTGSTTSKEDIHKHKLV